jgi:hypothetical protein
MGCALNKTMNGQPQKLQREQQQPKDRTWSQRLRDGDAPEVGGVFLNAVNI